MKHFLHSGSRWIRLAGLALLTLPMLSLTAGDSTAADDTPAALSPPKGFIMDMTPLLDERTGRLRAIAPGCRAVTGIIESQPFVWSRDFGMVRIPVPRPDYGMGVFLGDDGRTMTGFLSRDDQTHPAGYSQTWAQAGFIWHYKGKKHFMSRHGLIDVNWRGLSADGRVAFGQGKEPVPGAPLPDAPGEEWDRFIGTPQGKKAMERGYVFNRPLWFIREGTRYRELPRFMNERELPQRIMSRDGKKIIRFHARNSSVFDLETGKNRQLTFGGAVADGTPDEERTILRAGDPDSPLFRWGRSKYAMDNRLYTDAEIAALQKEKRLSPESPMLRNWHVDEISHCVPNFDARYNLCYIWLKPYRPDISRDRALPSGPRLLARLDDKGGAIPIADDSGYAGPLHLGDISDDGKIVLYNQDREMCIWNEDIPTPRQHRNAWKLRDYLASFGLVLPPDRRIQDAIMSPDGRCFFGMLSALEGEKRFPYQEFLACTGEDIKPPYWSLKTDVKNTCP